MYIMDLNFRETEAEQKHTRVKNFAISNNWSVDTKFSKFRHLHDADTKVFFVSVMKTW